ncbi:MAG: DUF3732 domain-containing protein [Planctomycetes bacterium]|nr:DUF3732 domain-containing protein [Planctomycetota bacterium]
MRFQLQKIVLWPRSNDRPPRIVEFQPDSVNVISGASRTGKSAIIPLIDYCLGAERCAIPVETIRNACGWFGIVVSTSQGQKLFARREPGDQKSTGDMFLLEGQSIEIPARISAKNGNADGVKAQLDELAGLSRLDFDFEQSGSGFKGRPSFGDLKAFMFQPQNVVANPDVLFFKADTYEHREKLKTIFPYVLRAITPEILAARHELEVVNRQLARKERELENLRNVSERWQAEMRAWAVQAREFGLISTAIPANASREELFELLKDAATRVEPAIPDSAGVEEAMTELVSLQREEGRTDTQLRQLRRRLAEMNKLKENAANVQDALAVQRDRLGIAEWLHSMQTEHVCPLCESVVGGESSAISELLTALADVQGDLQRVSASPASFDRELLRVKAEFDLNLEKLNGIAIRKNEVERRTSAGRDAQYRASEISRFLGRLDRALEMQGALSDGGALTEEVQNLRQRQKELSRIVGQAGIESRTRRALDRVSNFAGRLLPGLDAERPDDPIELSLTDLTIKVKSSKRDDYLWEVGSGANWLSYHVAVSLALQQFFLSDPPSPVPGILVYDQPSQVYFPRRLADPKSNEDDPTLRDENIEAVRKVFSTLAIATQAAKGDLQVLVLDHAGLDVWSGIPGVHLVEEWRDGKKLVPMEWLI